MAAGDTVEAIVQKFSGGYEFEVYDVTTSTEAAMSVSSTVATGDSADAVAEDVQENQYELADFGPSGFQVNSVNTNRNQLPNGLAGDNPTPLVLKNNYGNGSTVLAQPGAISGDGTFTDQWKSCTPGNQ